jgi:hypothetical protein
MRKSFALACALPLLWVSYALACSPDLEGDPWFDLVVKVNAKTLPQSFILTASKIEKAGRRDCILADGTRFEGTSLSKLASRAKNNFGGDGRPAHLKLPKPETVKLEVYCDPQHYVAHGRLAYVPLEHVPGSWGSHMELDVEAVGHLIMTQPSAKWSRSASGDLNIDRVQPAQGFCTMSAERVFDDLPASGPHTFGHGSLSLAALASATKHVGIVDSRHITARDAATVRTFEVYVDCYGSMNAIDAKIHYTLNRRYVPDRVQKSIDACSRRAEH